MSKKIEEISLEPPQTIETEPEEVINKNGDSHETEENDAENQIQVTENNHETNNNIDGTETETDKTTVVPQEKQATNKATGKNKKNKKKASKATSQDTENASEEKGQSDNALKA